MHFMLEETTPPQTSYTGNVLDDLSVTANTTPIRTTSTEHGYVIKVVPCEYGYYWSLYFGDDRINGGLEDKDWRAYATAQDARRKHQNDRERGAERESER